MTRDELQRFPATGGGPAAGLLRDGQRCPSPVGLDILDPKTYGAQAERIGGGRGRGAAWFVRGVFGEGVLRHYRRGGLLGRVVRESYVWAGAEHTRCVREYRLLRSLHAQGLPVPAPLAAGWWRYGPVYRQALLIERIADTRTLAQQLSSEAAAVPWEAVGAMLARFHAAGVDHADLNAHNVLLDARDTPWLIDFDRGTQGLPDARRAERNLARLRRSLQKLGGQAGEAGWQKLRDAWRAS